MGVGACGDGPPLAMNHHPAVERNQFSRDWRPLFESLTTCELEGVRRERVAFKS